MTDGPEVLPETPAGSTLTDLVLTSFRLNGLLMDAAQRMAAAGDMTAAWWQVLGGVLDEPRSVADVGRRMGLTRQAVQRIADLLVSRGLAEYRENQAHRRAKLLACTDAGYLAIRHIATVQHPWADRVGSAVGIEPLRDAEATLRRLIEVLETERP